MNPHETDIKPDDPFEILGVGHTATDVEIRRRYLELIKQHPPERDPERFREIHQAYEFAKDPLRLAERLLSFSPHCPEWEDVIKSQKKRPPAISAAQLLALGNIPPEMSTRQNVNEGPSSE